MNPAFCARFNPTDTGRSHAVSNLWPTRFRERKILSTLKKYLGFAWTTVRHQGLRHSLSDVVAELAFDWRHGVETIMPHELDSRDIAASSFADGVQYQGANPKLVQTLLQALPPAARQAEFVDFGCGKGRALLLAAEQGFEKLTGIEFSANLAETARQNLARSRHFNRQVQHEVVTQDVADYAIPASPAVLFFYNPFGGETLRRVVSNIRRRLAANPKDLWVVYVNPKGLAVFTQANFKPVHSLRRNGKLLGLVLEAG